MTYVYLGIPTVQTRAARAAGETTNINMLMSVMT